MSLIPERLKTLGEEDRLEANELRVDVGFVLEIILQNCNACLYVCCHQHNTITQTQMNNMILTHSMNNTKWNAYNCSAKLSIPKQRISKKHLKASKLKVNEEGI